MKIEIYLTGDEAAEVLIDKYLSVCPPGEWKGRVNFGGYGAIEITFEPVREEATDE